MTLKTLKNVESKKETTCAEKESKILIIANGSK